MPNAKDVPSQARGAPEMAPLLIFEAACIRIRQRNRFRACALEASADETVDWPIVGCGTGPEFLANSVLITGDSIAGSM